MGSKLSISLIVGIKFCSAVAGVACSHAHIAHTHTSVLHVEKINSSSIRRIPREQHFLLWSRHALGGTPLQHHEDKWCSGEVGVAAALFNDATERTRPY